VLYLPFLSRAEALYSDKEATPFSSKGLSIKKLEGKLSVVIKTKDVSAGVSLSPAIVCRRYEAGTKGCSPVYASCWSMSKSLSALAISGVRSASVTVVW